MKERIGQKKFWANVQLRYKDLLKLPATHYIPF